MNRTILGTGTLVAALAASSLAPAPLPVAAQVPPEELPPDPAVVEARAAAAAQGDLQPGPDPTAGSAPSVDPPAPAPAGAATRGAIGRCAGLGEACWHSQIGRAYLPQAGTYIRAQIPNDWAKNDNPGILTTTLRIWGTDWAQTESGTAVDLIRHVDQMTCTGVGISGVSVGMSGLSVSGGGTSSTATARASNRNRWYLQRYYQDDAHWRCKASNVSSAKVTRRLVADVTHKEGTTAPQATYTFWF